MVLAAFVILHSPAVKAPAWLDRTVAGYRVAVEGNRSQAGVFDRHRNIYLVRSVECDGAHINVTLTRDRHVVSDWGYRVPSLPESQGDLELQEKSLATLATGRGIRIGDDEKTLVARLGKATKIERTGSRHQFRNHVYVWRDVKNGEGAVWTNEYVFKEGRLIEIRFGREAVPGC